MAAALTGFRDLGISSRQSPVLSRGQTLEAEKGPPVLKIK
jgi:hypothetical protein